MRPKRPATQCPTRNAESHDSECPQFAGYLARFHGIQPHKRARVPRQHAVTVEQRLAVAKVVSWLCLVIVIAVAVGSALQLVAENIATRADANEQAQPVDLVDARRDCPAVNHYVNRGMTIDELHDLQDVLCPTMSEPQRTGN